MKYRIALLLLTASLLACQNDSTQNVRDNETPAAATDVTNNYETERDTTANLSDTARLRIADTTEIR
jgi:hypothetical protein